MVEPELRHTEIIAEDEPRYLRRQKPVEIRRRKFGRRAWIFYLKVLAGVGAGLLGLRLLYVAWDFAMNSPRVALSDLEQIEVHGVRNVPRPLVLEKFSDDEGASVLSVPLHQRRAAIQEIPWVERASVRRVLPNRIRVDIVERTPVAFLRTGSELGLIDANGVILERPLEGDFRFPVVTGINENTPSGERRKRMQAFVQFLNDVELARTGAGEFVSEVDLADPDDLRVVLTGLPEFGKVEGQVSLLVHFGAGDYSAKFRVVTDNFQQWRADVGRVYSVDLRFQRQVVVNPETPAAQSLLGGKAAGTRR